MSMNEIKNGHHWPGCKHDATGKASKPYKPVTWPRDLTGPASIGALVQRAAKHYRALHAANGGRVEIHVYPANKSNRGHSADFRHYLASGLIDRGWVDRYFTGYRSPVNDRATTERQAADLGYIFVEYTD